MKIRVYELGDRVLRKISSIESNVSQRYRWRVLCHVLDINPSGHLVKILVSGVKLPYVNGIRKSENGIRSHADELLARLIPVCWQCDNTLAKTAVNLTPCKNKK